MIKKKIIPLALIALALTSLQACNSGGNKDSAANDTTASAQATQQEKLEFVKDNFHKRVKAADADTCIKLYLKTRKDRTLKAPAHISYLQEPLTTYLNELQKVAGDYDTLRIALGLYTESVLRENRGDIKDTGKVTMFLVPYSKKTGWARYKTEQKSQFTKPGDEDDRVDAYNLGDIHP